MQLRPTLCGCSSADIKAKAPTRQKAQCFLIKLNLVQITPAINLAFQRRPSRAILILLFQGGVNRLALDTLLPKLLAQRLRAAWTKPIAIFYPILGKGFVV